MNDPWAHLNVENRYWLWLLDHFTSVANPNPSRGYNLLAEQMHRKEFLWIVPNDDNRIADGMGLRIEFARSTGFWYTDKTDIWDGCSVLEMLIALAKRLVFETQDSGLGFEFADWFMILLENLGLKEFTDEEYLSYDSDMIKNEVDNRLDRLLTRSYRYDGSGGGLFPLRDPKEDQRSVEIWYQANSYLLELGDLV